MAYSEKVIDHYENPRNVGKFDDEDESVGTGMVGAPACGDVMRLQIKVGDDGVIVYTEDSGESWTRQATPSHVTLHDVMFVSAARGWAVGQEGTLLETSNGGQHWTPTNTPFKGTLHAVH